MDNQMEIEEFAGHVLKIVKTALPQELQEARVCVTMLDIGDDAARMALLVCRPWDGTTTGFYLDDWHRQYLNETATIESAVAAIINDRRLYYVANE